MLGGWPGCGEGPQDLQAQARREAQATEHEVTVGCIFTWGGDLGPEAQTQLTLSVHLSILSPSWPF